MLKWRINRTIDLTNNAMRVERLRALATLSTRIAHELHIGVLENKVAAELDGLSVKLSVILPDKSSLMDAFDGKIDDHEVVMTLPDICYSQKGEVKGVLYLADGEGGMLPVYAFVLLVAADLTDIFIDPANVVPSISELLAQMETMRETTTAAQAATQNANTAAENANKKAAVADAAAKTAVAAAVAADGWAKATATAEMLGADAEPVVTVTTAEDGQKIIAFQIPRGETGATPAITFEVATGEPGTQVQVKQSGTAEKPVVKLTIPRGDTGKIDGLDYYEDTPKAPAAAASPGTSSAVARGDHVHPLPSASDVGALPSGGTAADASKLDGKTWAELMLTVYPVGSIYMSVNSISPASLFGGAWEQLKDRFLLGVGDTYSNGDTGGAATVTLTVSQIPRHNHPVVLYGENWTDASHENVINQAVSAAQYGAYSATGGAQYRQSGSTSMSTGGGGSHENMPPYLAVYMWKRVS